MCAKINMQWQIVGIHHVHACSFTPSLTQQAVNPITPKTDDISFISRFTACRLPLDRAWATAGRLELGELAVFHVCFLCLYSMMCNRLVLSTVLLMGPLWAHTSRRICTYHKTILLTQYFQNTETVQGGT